VGRRHNCAWQALLQLERANRDDEEILASWMADNKSKDWSMTLKFVQFQKNRALNSGRLLLTKQYFLIIFI